MNDRTFDNDDAHDPGSGEERAPTGGGSSEPDGDRERSLEDRWQSFLSGEAEQERKRRLEERPAGGRLLETGGRASAAGEEGAEPPVRAGDERQEPQEEQKRAPRTRAEELRALQEARAEAREPAEPGGLPPGEGRVGDGGREPGSPVVVPGKDELDLPLWRRRWKPIAAGAVLLVAGFLLVRGVGSGGESATPALDTSGVDADRVRVLADSLEASIGRYRERERDFDLNRLDCAGLSRGYEGVQAALDGLRSAAPSAEDLAAGPLRTRYRSLVSRADTVEEDYAAAGCAETP